MIFVVLKLYMGFSSQSSALDPNPMKKRGRPRGRVVGPTITIRLDNSLDRQFRRAVFEVNVPLVSAARSLLLEGLFPGTQKLAQTLRDAIQP